MKSKTEQRSLLLNNCYCSRFAVHPKNWEKPDADPDCQWYFTYRFYDPLFKEKYPYGKLVQVRVNRFKVLSEKRKQMRSALNTEVDLITKEGYNPITGKYMADETSIIHYEIPPDTPLKEALKLAFDKIKVVNKTDIRSVLRHATIAIEQLRYENLAVSSIKKAHMRRVLERIGENKGSRWTANNYNYHRAHLSMLFKELIAWDTIETNPMTHISKMKVVKRKRTTLTDKERDKVYFYLKANNYVFWRFMNIFYLSGCRTSEILRVQAKGVDLKGQTFKTLTLKGRAYREVEYTISNDALHFWEEALKNCEPEQFVFSKFLLPGDNSIDPHQISRRWLKYVKKPLDITADWYSLKHFRTTQISDTYGTAIAASVNNESETMIKQVYDLNNDKRAHNTKKKIKTNFLSQA